MRWNLEGIIHFKFHSPLPTASNWLTLCAYFLVVISIMKKKIWHRLSLGSDSRVKDKYLEVYASSDRLNWSKLKRKKLNKTFDLLHFGKKIHTIRLPIVIHTIQKLYCHNSIQFNIKVVKLPEILSSIWSECAGDGKE
jgi:hypothetical protein